MRDVILLDLGGTLAEYYGGEEWHGVLSEAVSGVRETLRRAGKLRIGDYVMWERIRLEDHESPDHRVRPLEGRLSRIFEISDPATLTEACSVFLKPIFARGRVYPDAVPALKDLRSRGRRLVIVSNSPWGSPADPWRLEVERLGLGRLVDESFFCRDAGWRKPARGIFEWITARLGVEAGRCLFVGDNPRWDVEGPRAAGIEALLIDRSGAGAGGALSSLSELASVA